MICNKWSKCWGNKASSGEVTKTERRRNQAAKRQNYKIKQKAQTPEGGGEAGNAKFRSNRWGNEARARAANERDAEESRKVRPTVLHPPRRKIQTMTLYIFIVEIICRNNL